MDFGAMPPEVNSGRMYAGPGSETMVAAAAAWEGLAAELRSTAESYGSIIAGMTGESWEGPASTAMASAAAPYIAWMRTTAAQSEHTAAQARAAATAYDSAFAATVPPPVIAANRSELASLMATNILGQNTPAIAANEAHYGQMWAEDAAAMYGYAAQSASASALTPFATPTQATNPGGLLDQLLTALQTAGTSIGNSAQSQLSQLLGAVPDALQNLATIGSSSNPLQGFLSTLQSLAGMQNLSSAAGYLELIPKVVLPANDAIISILLGLGLGTKAAASLPAGALAPPAAVAGSVAPSAGAESALAAGLGSAAKAADTAGITGSAVSAGVGNADSVGGLAVPPTWTEATPTIRVAADVLRTTSVGAAPAAVATSGSAELLGQMAGAGFAGSAAGTAACRAVGATVTRVAGSRTGENPDEAGANDSSNGKKTPDKLKRVLAEMSKTPESVQHWHTDEARLDDLIGQLSNKPGVHAVHVARRGKAKFMRPKI